MSILDPITPPAPSPCAVAAILKSRARVTYEMMVRSFNDGAFLFWSNPNATPEQIAECLGADGRELFQLHARIGALLSEINPASVAASAALVGQFHYGPEGRVIVEQPLP